LLFTPLVVLVTQRAGRNPIPYLIGLATAANIGSVATIAGNPQNVIIGQASGIPYLTFLLRLGPVALIGLFLCWLLIVLLYPSEFRGQLAHVHLPPPQTYPPLLKRTMLIVIGLLIAFLLGAPIASAAFIAAAFLFVSRVRPSKLLSIEWDLLAFFAALFIVTGAIETTGISKELFKVTTPIIESGLGAFSVVTVILSNVVSNVPAVLLFRPLIPTLANPERMWLALAMASTLAGNLTLLGSVANLIVAEVAGTRGVKLTFVEYLKVGLPLTLITVVIGVLWLTFT
jgi:Na+/H+ antiporter NhaD/arsenite permease-like protein